MALHLTSHRHGFPRGFTTITALDDAGAPDVGIALGIWRIEAEGKASRLLERETAFLLLAGEVDAKVPGARETLRRRSLFDEGPACVHAPRGALVSFAAKTELEIAVFQVANEDAFPPRIVSPALEDGTGGDARARVRPVLDEGGAPTGAHLRLDEGVLLPGAWAAHPRRGPPAAELYHYRFSHPKGYGHAELGDDVIELWPNDTVKVPAAAPHARVTAPGHCLYYARALRRGSL